jgi:hypothetical protein
MFMLIIDMDIEYERRVQRAKRSRPHTHWEGSKKVTITRAADKKRLNHQKALPLTGVERRSKQNKRTTRRCGCKKLEGLLYLIHGH